MNVHISQRYRQSLQPYVEPELLEGIYSLPQPIKLAKSEPVVIPSRHGYCKSSLMFLLAGLCAFGSAYYQKTDLQQQLLPIHIENVIFK